MARDYAKVGTDIWLEPSIRALTLEAQWLYLFLLTQPELNRCGVVPWRPARWTAHAANLSPAKLKKAAKELTDGAHIVVDKRTDDALVRTYMRHDGLLSQPLVVSALCSDFRALTSEVMRDAILTELRRIWDLDISPSERKGLRLILGDDPKAHYDKNVQRIADAIGGGLVAPIRDAVSRSVHAQYGPDPQGDPPPYPLAKGLADPLRDPSPDPLADRLGEAPSRPRAPAARASSVTGTGSSPVTGPGGSAGPSPLRAVSDGQDQTPDDHAQRVAELGGFDPAKLAAQGMDWTT